MRCTPHTHMYTHRISIPYTHSHMHLGVYYISAMCVHLNSKWERQRERVSERCLGTTSSIISIGRVNRKRFQAEYSTTYGFCTGPPSVRRGDCDDGTFIIALIKHTTRRDRYASHRFDKPLRIMVLYNIIYSYFRCTHSIGVVSDGRHIIIILLCRKIVCVCMCMCVCALLIEMWWLKNHNGCIIIFSAHSIVEISVILNNLSTNTNKCTVMYLLYIIISHTNLLLRRVSRCLFRTISFSTALYPTKTKSCRHSCGRKCARTRFSWRTSHRPHFHTAQHNIIQTYVARRLNKTPSKPLFCRTSDKSSFCTKVGKQ